MGLQIQGNNGAIAEVSGTTFRALRTENKPIDYGALGAYSYGGFTGILPAALGANSEIYQFRWADATRLAVIRKVRISACVSTTFFAGGGSFKGSARPKPAPGKFGGLVKYVWTGKGRVPKKR